MKEPDENACAVHEPTGAQVGFLNRRLAAVLAPVIDAGVEYDVEDLAVADGGRRPALEVLLGNLEQSLSDVSNALTASYFTHIERPYQLVEEDLLPA